ncbi:MAG: hypothetical protein A3B70_02090 [Deltaproteobacteria bacterium RIFCSPHIGHO2_02_FULL_40_11]|nr:MAG: hypothetical protein A3B70_02090 [Deltaproteobacteria bacterium RIFCSPHIGHO2_02_FULL_40_11]
MNILVTGGAGYLGSILVPKLLSLGHKVTVIDRLMYQQNSLLDVCYHKNLTFIRGDVRDENLIQTCLKKADVIYPLACLTGAPICDRDPWAAKAINFEAVSFIGKNKSKDQWVIFPNTNSGYGVGESGMYCTEESPLRPVSLYGKLKVAAEKELLNHENVICFRLATVFGVSPRMRLDLLVNDFVFRALKDGFIVLYEPHFKRNYIHIRDVTKAFVHGLTHFTKMKNEAYNVGLSSANLSKKELCESIKEYIPSFYFTEAKLGKDPDQRNYIVSNEKIEKTGYAPDYALQDGIQELIKAYPLFSHQRYSNI